MLKFFRPCPSTKLFFISLEFLLVVFFVLHFLFFERLGEVIRLREHKTVRLNNLAEEKFVEGEKLASTYRERITEAKKEAQEFFNRHKKEIVEQENASLDASKKEIQLQLGGKQREVEKRLLKLEEKSLQQVEPLADQLVERVAQ